MMKGGDLSMEKYEVAFEVAGPAAMFARPDTGSTPISYSVNIRLDCITY